MDKRKKTIYTKIENHTFTFNSITEAAKWVITTGFSKKGSVKSVIAKISDALNPNNSRKKAFGLIWECDDYIKQTKNNYAIKQLDKEGNVIAIYPSAIEAAKAFGKSESTAGHIREVCKKKRNFALGYRWEYLTHSYKGYYTIVNYDCENQFYYGKIEDINDFVNYEAENISDTENQFHLAVDDYLDMCKHYDKVPDKPEQKEGNKYE